MTRDPFMDYLDGFGEELASAARRTARPRPRWRSWPLALGVVGVTASTALAAVALKVGTPAPGTYGVGSPVTGPGRPLDGTAQVLAVRADDPAGGPPWGIRTFTTRRGAACWQVGRVQGGQLGWLGRDGLSGNDGLFHPLPLQDTSCRTLDGAGHLFAVQSGAALANGNAGQQRSCRMFPDDPPGKQTPRCPQEDLRFVQFGFLGPELESVRTAGGADVPTAGGAFLRVQAVDDLARVDVPRLTATFTKGRRWPVTDIAPLEAAYGATPDGSAPPGFVTPLRSLPDPSRLRADVSVRPGRMGRNVVYLVSFDAPVASRRFGVDYGVVLRGGEHTAGRSCEAPMRFRTDVAAGDVRAGQRLTVRLSPSSALRWNRGWCPGTYTGRVVLHDAAHTVGRFTIRVR